MLTAATDPKDDQTLIIRPAGFSHKFMRVCISKCSCAHVDDGVSIDWANCEDPLYAEQILHGGVLSFADLEAIYWAARKARGLYPSDE